MRMIHSKNYIRKTIPISEVIKLLDSLDYDLSIPIAQTSFEKISEDLDRFKIKIFGFPYVTDDYRNIKYNDKK